MKNGAPKLLFPRVFSSAEMSRNSSINKSFKLLKFHFASNFGFNERIFEHLFCRMCFEADVMRKISHPREGCVLRGQVRTRVSSVASVEESEVDR